MLSALCALLLGAATAAGSATPPPRASLDAVLRAIVASGRPGTVRVIVRARPDCGAGLEAAIASVEGTLLTRIEAIHAVTARVETQRLTALQNHPAVASISSDGPVTPAQAAR